MEIKPSPMMLIIKLALLLFAATMVLGFRTPLGVGIAVGAIVLEQWLNYKTDQYKQKRR